MVNERLPEIENGDMLNKHMLDDVVDYQQKWGIPL